MLSWTEYAIVRHGVQLREAMRPLTKAQQYGLDLCEAMTKRLEVRESLPAADDPPRRRSGGWNSRVRVPLATSHYHG